MTDILVLLFAPTGRDAEAIIPLCYLLEKKFKYNLEFGSMFDYAYLIGKHKPKVLLLNNIDGSEFNVKAANFAYKSGVKVISLVSEGLFRKDIIDLFIWGNNKEKNINWHKMFVWSEKFLKYCQDYMPKNEDLFEVSGSTGIDRYKIYKFLSKEELLKKYKKIAFKKVIMYGGFTFGIFFNNDEIDTYGYSKKYISWHKEEMFKVKKILKEIITNNPDKLFILKMHPGEKNDYMEIDKSWDFSNVLIFKDEEPLADLINTCDIYFIYRSSTSFEAYALGKPVINILRPEPALFYKQDDQKGNALIRSAKSAQQVINQYYQTGKIDDFNIKNEVRERLIKEKVDSIDGLNSWRTAKKINLLIKDIKDQKLDIEYSLYDIAVHWFLLLNKFFQVLPRYKKSPILKKYNDFGDFFPLMNSHSTELKKFYREIKKP